MAQVLVGVLLLTQVVVSGADRADDCTYQGVDYSSTIGVSDYVQISEYYANYEFVVNVCRQLSWISGNCDEGAGVCERLTQTQTATDVYGRYSRNGVAMTTWETDVTGDYVPENTEAPYIQFWGDACMFGGTMSARVYHECKEGQATPFIAMVHESYFDCQVYFSIHSEAACVAPPPPGGRSKSAKEERDIGFTLCVLFFLGVGLFFGIGIHQRKKAGHEGWDRVPAKEFFTTIPGLAWDGCIFSWMKCRDNVNAAREARAAAGADTEYDFTYNEKTSLMP